MDAIQIEAERRHASHKNHPTHRPLSINYELIGLRGEEALAIMFGGAVDLRARPNGDGGRDNIIHTDHGTFPVDVKAARKPYNLIVETGKLKPRTIYILARYDEAEDRAILLAWEWSAALRAAPVKDFGYGVKNHYIPRAILRPLDELRLRQCPAPARPSAS